MLPRPGVSVPVCPRARVRPLPARLLGSPVYWSWEACIFDSKFSHFIKFLWENACVEPNGGKDHSPSPRGVGTGVAAVRWQKQRVGQPSEAGRQENLEGACWSWTSAVHKPIPSRRDSVSDPQERDTERYSVPTIR